MGFADDVVAIEQLKARYIRALDEGRTDDLLELFVDDVTYDTTPVFPDQPAMYDKNALRAFFDAVTREPGKFHLAATPLISVDGDTASGSWRFMAGVAGWTARRSATNHLRIDVIANYEDEYRRVDGEWKFASVRIEGLAAEPAS